LCNNPDAGGSAAECGESRNLALTGNYCPKSKKENSVSALKTTGSRLPETWLIS